MPPVRKNKPKSKKPVAETLLNDEPVTVISGQLDKKIKKQQAKKENRRGIVFIKHLPHGFFEEQLKKYFEQFGNVTRLRLARSKRTGGSKGFAFVEFEYPEVAQVAAETMDNYLMFKKVVKASYIPPEKQTFNFFKTSLRKVKNKAGKEIYISSKTAAIQRKVKMFNNWSDVNYQKRTLLRLEKVKKLNKKYAHLGIDFSQIVVTPNLITNESVVKNVDGDDHDEDVEKDEEEGTSSAEVKRIPPPKKVQKRKAQNDVALEDLLGNTINDDSDDDDYVGISEVEESNEEEHNTDDTSDEETYKHLIKINTQKKSKKPAKSSNIDGFKHLVMRKPHLGAIKKNKISNKPAATNAKKSMQVSVAKQIAKPLSEIKQKHLKVKAKVGKKSKQ